MPVGTQAEIVAAARALIVQGDFGAVLVSLSEDGMILVEADGAGHPLAAAAREVFDVSGAGDTVIAVLTLGLIAGLTTRRSEIETPSERIWKMSPLYLERKSSEKARC